MKMMSSRFAFGLSSLLLMASVGCQEESITQQACMSPQLPVSVNFTEIKYSNSVTKDELDRLSKYLLTIGFANGDERVVSIDKRGNTYIFQIAVLPSAIADFFGQSLFRAFAAEVSREVFNGAPVDVHLCDPQLRPLVVAPMHQFGTESKFDQLQVFYGKGLKTQADALGQYLVAVGFAKGKASSIQLNKLGTAYQVKLVVKSGIEKDASHHATFNEIPKIFSKEVFKGAPVSFQITDSEFTTLKSFESSK